MMNKTQISQFRTGFTMLVGILFLTLLFTQCKPTKNITEPISTVDTMILYNINILNQLLDPNCTKTLDEKEEIVNDIKSQNRADEKTRDLIAQVESMIKKEREENLRALEDNEESQETVEMILNNSFDQVAKAQTLDEANTGIESSLTYFSSENANVLVVISEEGGEKDYEKPTTIRKYLEYLKDQKSNPNTVSRLVYDENQKIKTIELIKK